MRPSNEILDENDDIKNILHEAAYTTLFPKHYLGRSILGTTTSLKQIKQKDVQDFYELYYKNQTPVIGIFTNKYLNLTEILSSKKPKKNSPKNCKVTLSPEKIQKIKIVKHRGARSAIGLYYRTVPITNSIKDIISLNILKNCLGNCWSSILVNELRTKKSLTYWVDATTFFSKDAGIFEITVQCETQQIENIFTVIKNNIKILLSGNLDNDVFKAAKEMHLTAVADEFSSLTYLLEEIIFRKTIGIPELDPNEYLKTAKKITKNDILEVASKFLLEENQLVVKVIETK
ncbi:hypothetical protein CO173_04140 [Candidatus Uhrbacteria bacterium CG_4_9_14_3_um_filter_41_35]|uniref:Peptidase M16 C-terminal domain-containing protein n=1 Tax=Candidatus Uhrbacteria bacterium CG_4_9_14_3_um_filter_41_35 TaxID=1975034 RepID=A0A2M7XDG6_9BACT|nr:MAG: hypothetical protein COV92_02415 [Candidatus Uhrbacteria bacterium CG11_big_fil_rev_8_21_14_0_20_41_9]PJA45928.1 MAG: hypothetical protein CO173_04140 [Candidatus Uhrbacteria bacterium CG_4_9_14_3_um_filter_41_35]